MQNTIEERTNLRPLPVPGAALDPAEAALVQLGRLLREAGYEFTTVTPETHRRVNAASEPAARTLRDIFGWSRPFDPRLLPDAFMQQLEAAGALRREGALLRSGVRYSSLGGLLLSHTAYPTEEEDSVFFGPDTYRFARLLHSVLSHSLAGSVRSLLDLGCGSGAGGIFAASRLGPHCRITLSDISARALGFARANAALAGLPQVECVLSDGFSEIEGSYDLIVCNPPYLADAAGRLYRNGGGLHGSGLTLRFAGEALTHLNPGGSFVLYSGSAIRGGQDELRQRLETLFGGQGLRHRYEELDADVFGEELERPAYAGVDRIAAIGVLVQKELG